MPDGDAKQQVAFTAEVGTALAGPVEHLYVHYPFCMRKCPYCDFNSHAGRDDEIDPYVEALLEEARAWRDLVRPRTLFVGGGTPTNASATQLERYLGGLRALFDDTALAEFTIEANPGSLDAAKVRALRRVGVDRVSLGVQSFEDRHLATLGRVHDAADAVRGVEILRRGGIARLSVDLILAIPGQDLAAQGRDLERAVDLGPEHVSAYVLTFEEGTAFTRRMRAGQLPAPDDERELAHLHLACDRLAAAGYARYEISNFARGGAVSRHNLAYWRGANWIGLGAGAHSHVAGRRWKNVDDPAAYAAGVRAGRAPTAWEERSDAPTHLFEDLMMGLRLLEGVDLDTLSARHGIDVRATHGVVIARHVGDGLLDVAGGRLRLTTRGFDLANHVVAGFLPDADARPVNRPPARLAVDGSDSPAAPR